MLAARPFVMDAVQHLVEPPDLWVKRIEPRFRDRAPRVGPARPEQAARARTEGRRDMTLEELKRIVQRSAKILAMECEPAGAAASRAMASSRRMNLP